MACIYLQVVIDQFDIDISTGNSSPIINNAVYLRYTDCEANPQELVYTAAGTYYPAICADNSEMIVLNYYVNNNEYVSFASSWNNDGSCAAASPTPTNTPTSTPTSTPTLS